jgi:hypothetical protein
VPPSIAFGGGISCISFEQRNNTLIGSGADFDVGPPFSNEQPLSNVTLDENRITNCDDGRDAGVSCNAIFDGVVLNMQYYWNAQRQECLAFMYKGCGGNGNRYSTKADCEQKCLPCMWTKR